MFGDQYRNKRVLVTGHTGFKGSWLSEWLLMLGAEVSGFSLEVGEVPDHFTQLGLAGRIHHTLGDVRDPQAVQRAIREAQPDFVFHLAAQSLVRRSYREPLLTMATNIMGTVHVLEALREAPRKVSCVVVTSDKCYENRDLDRGYCEDDPLGGHDPYSASKGAAEIVTHAYRRSFFDSSQALVSVASARAGNVIGGGDWSEDRIVPDCVRSLVAGTTIAVRNPQATRPWQHVLEPLGGYLWLGALLADGASLVGANSAAKRSAFNFGPSAESHRTVGCLASELLKHWPGQWEATPQAGAPHEARLLSLNIEKASHVLKWCPVWNFERCVKETALWYRAVSRDHAPAGDQTRANISRFMADARQAGQPWAPPLAPQPTPQS